MRPRFITKSSLLLLACAACVSQVHAAGEVAATSGYLTIQPNATNDAYVYTFSWVARDTDNAGQGNELVPIPIYTDSGANSNGFGNGSAALDTVTNLGGGDYTFDNSANGGSTVSKIRYLPDDLATYTHATYGTHTRYVDGGFNGVQSATSVVNTWVGYGAYVAGDLAVGDANPLSTITAKFDTVGNFAKNSRDSIAVAAGVEGVTGVFSTNPNGTGAATGNGVGFWIDHDGADDATGTDDFGPILVGYDNVRNLTGTNKMPNTGYVQVVVPYPTTNVVSDAFIESFNVGTYTNNAAVEVFVTTDSSYVPKIALAGDMDSDFDIDNADIGVITGNFTGSVGAAGGKWYATGDMTADGDVDNADIGIVTGGFTGSLAGNLTNTSGIPDLIYDALTGNLTVDTAGKSITSFQFENGGAGTFAFANYDSPENFPTNLFGFSFEQVNGNVIGDSDGLNVGFTGTHNFGNILPTGLTQVQLEAYLSTAFWGTFGNSSGDFDLVVLSPIPEPSNFVVLGFCVLGGLVHRRRNLK